jgi:hypothetical protein
MKSMTKRIIRSGLVAAGLTMLVPVGAAVAGEWRLDARACPDLREDRRDMRRDRGRYDRREDRRDARVINCPARAWYYVPDRYERRSDWRPARPREVVIFRDGRPYYRDTRGGLVSLNLNLRL